MAIECTICDENGYIDIDISHDGCNEAAMVACRSCDGTKVRRCDVCTWGIAEHLSECGTEAYCAKCEEGF